MNTYLIVNDLSGHIFGIYLGHTPEEAMTDLFRDAAAAAAAAHGSPLRAIDVPAVVETTAGALERAWGSSIEEWGHGPLDGAAAVRLVLDIEDARWRLESWTGEWADPTGDSLGWPDVEAVLEMR